MKDPNALIQTYVNDSKAKRTNPDKVKTFSNKTNWSDGVVVYDVEDSKQGQKDVREVADTHFGKKFQNWCLIHRSRENSGTTIELDTYDTFEEARNEISLLKSDPNSIYTIFNIRDNDVDAGLKGYTIVASDKAPITSISAAFKNWKHYNEKGNGHKVAFHNGKLISFRDGNQMQWWDINDRSFDAPVIRGKKGKDGFKPVSLAYKNNVETIFSEKQVGDNKNGTYTKRRLDGVVVIRETKKDGKLHGEQMVIRENASSFYDTKTTTTHDANSDSRMYTKVTEERFYKDFRSKSGIDKISFGIDDITVDNITNWKVVMDEANNTSVRTIEGTVNQKYFDFFKDPSAMKKEFPTYTLEQLTYAHSRYYGIQGKKVKLVITGETYRSETISFTIDGVEQSFNPKFSSSKKIEVEHELTAREENILLPSYLNKEINRLKNTQDISTEESELLEILEEMRNLSGSGAVNIYNIMLNAFPYAFKNMVVADFSSEQSFVDAIKRNTQAQMKINAYNTSKRILEKQTIDLKPEQAVPKIVDYLINLGRDVRSALIIPTNKGLKIDLINGLQDGKFKDYFRAEPISKGSSKYKMQYKNSKGEFVDVEIYDSVKKIKENINKPGERARFNEQAERAQEYRLNLLDPKNKDHTLGDKLDNIELANTGTKGGGRKTAKVDVTITTDVDVLNKYSKIVAKLILEHEVTIKNMKAYERAYAKGNISREQMKSVYEQNKVHILPEGIDTVLQEAGKVSQRLGMGYESIPTAEKYLIDLLEKGIIDKLPDSLDTLFVRKSENFKDMVLFSKSTNKPTKGITILDFDDTLATSSSLIRFTRPDGTRGTLTPEQYASTYQDLLGLDYKFDFSEFNKVVDGKPAPLLNKAKKLAGKFGTKNMFILTARPKESAVAIQKFLKENGLNIPLKNITGLGNSTADAKALWVLDKAAEGYNDFYFADDAIQNVKAVQNMLDQIDVKSKVQQARVKFSVSQDKYFNAILEDVSGIPAAKKFSQKVGEALGFGKGKFRFFIPPSHEDFVGLLYNFMGKGKKGNNHRNFFEKTLIKPLNRAYRKLNEHKQVIANNYKKLINHMPDIHNILLAKIPNTAFSYQDAVRVYLWNKAGHEIPGLSKTEETTLVNIVKSYSDLQKFADMLGKISLIKEGYTTPGENWLSGNIKFDLVDATGRVGRGRIFSEFIENADIIFSPENLNKIESIYGKNFREALEDVLYRTKTGSNRPTGGNRIINAWLDWVNASVGSTMFFNTRSALLQQLSFVNFMNFGDNNVFKAAARFADQKQYWSDWAMIFNSNYLKQRRSGAGFDVNANEIAREVSSSKEPFRAAVRYLLSIGFLPTQIGDSFAIAIGGSTFYRNRVNTYEKQGMSKKQAEEKAFLDFQEIAEETQQSARPDMISQQQASPLGRLVLAFQNVTSQYARIVKKSTLDLVKRRVSKGYVTQAQSDTANVSRIIYYGAIQSIIFYALQTALFSMMFGDDEEDEKLATKKERVFNGVLDSLLKGTGVYGAVVATLKNYIWKFTENQKSDAYFKTPAWEQLLQLMPPIGIKIRKWKQFERTIDWNKDAIKEMSLFDIDNPIYEGGSQAVEGFTNLPINRLYKKVQNIRAGMDSENAWWQRIASVLGWSKWDLGIEKSDKVKNAKSQGKKNKNKVDEEANKKLQEQERKDGETVFCAAISGKSGRCKKEALRGGSYCTIHVSVEESESGEKKQCKGRKTTGGRCKMQTNSKSGYCYYHD